MVKREDEKLICVKCLYSQAVTTIGNDVPVCRNCLYDHRDRLDGTMNDPNF